MKPRLTLPLLLAVVVTAGCSQKPVAVDAGVGTVTIEILDVEPPQTIRVDNVATGSTVEEVMRQIEEVPVEIHGSGTTAFLHSLGGKATGSTEGWIYEIDGEKATRGIGSTSVEPPTTITWRYGSAE